MSRMESEKVQLAPMTVGRISGSAFVEVPGLHRRLSLTFSQADYLEQLQHGLTIEQLAQSTLKKGALISFRELLGLVRELTELKVLLNRSFREALLDDESAPSWTDDLGLFAPGRAQALSADELGKLPFFRQLSPAWKDLLSRSSMVYKVGARQRLITSGQSTRDMFILLEGEAAVYKRTPDGRTSLLAKLTAPTVFGEVGFLLGQPRTADVVTWVDSRVVRIQFQPTMQALIKKEAAESLQRRFWVLHALSHSELFKELPTESLDELTFAGQVRELREGEMLFQEGSRGQSFYIVIQGQLRVTQSGRGLRVLNQGSCLGEIALMLTQGQRTASVIADKPSLVVEISHQEFYSLLARNLLLAAELEQLAHVRLRNG